MKTETKLKPNMEDLKIAIINAHRERDRIEQLEIVASAANNYLASITDGDSLEEILGYQITLEKALGRLESLADEK